MCGTVFSTGKSLVVPDVEEFPGHIACSSLSKSEVVVPLIREGLVVGVLDVDSEELNTFDEMDRVYLEKVAALLINNS